MENALVSMKASAPRFRVLTEKLDKEKEFQAKDSYTLAHQSVQSKGALV